MVGLLQRSLALKQTVYTVCIVVLFSFIVLAVEVVLAYQIEHDRLSSLSKQLTDAFFDASSKAAFHVDENQANVVLKGMMKFEYISQVEITTERGQRLALKSRAMPETFATPINNFLFGDITKRTIQLDIDLPPFPGTSEKSGKNSGRNMKVGLLSMQLSSDLMGQEFLLNTFERLLGLFLELLVLASALGFLFHLMLTRPFVTYADYLNSIDPEENNINASLIPKGHEQDELGLVVSRTNALLNRINDQQNKIVHREKVAALGSMLGEIAHELNNPLAVITAHAEILEETAIDTNTKMRARKILNPAERCTRIVKSFLSLVRQRKIEKTRVDVISIINEAIEMLDYPFKQRNIDLIFEKTSDEVWIEADASQLTQVVINILVNSKQAIETVDGHRTIWIKTGYIDKGQNAFVEISDDGPGIEESIMNQIFHPFFTTKKEGRGTGLGLSYSSNVILAHDGTIDVQSRVPNGVTFRFQIPAIRDESIEALPEHIKPVEKAHSKSILVIDDEEEMANVIVEILLLNGYSADPVFSAKAALPMLERNNYDVILTDIRMPDIDGISFYQIVSESHPHLAQKFVFISGDMISDDIHQCISKWSVPLIGKPFLIEELISAMPELSSEEDVN